MEIIIRREASAHVSADERAKGRPYRRTGGTGIPAPLMQDGLKHHVLQVKAVQERVVPEARHHEEHVSVGASLLASKLGDGQIAKRTSESALLAQTLEHVLQITYLEVRYIVTGTDKKPRQRKLVIGESREKKVVAERFHLHALDELHLLIRDTTRTMSTRDGNKGGSAVL